MNSAQPLKVERTISLSNLESAVELMLRQFKEVHDHQDVKIRFGNIKGPLGDALTSQSVPLHLEITDKEVPQEVSNATEKTKLS